MSTVSSAEELQKQLNKTSYFVNVWLKNKHKETYVVMRINPNMNILVRNIERVQK